MDINLADILYLFGENAPSLYILLGQNWLDDQLQYLNFQKEFIIPTSRKISIIYYILLTMNFIYDTTHFS